MTITVSAGPGEATVPRVDGLRRAEAQRRLEAAGFQVDVREETSDSVRRGRVVSSSPPENSQLEKGRTVVLIVSSGRERVEVPDVTGDREEAARRELEDAGLEVSVTEEETEDREPGTVLEQDPAAGAEVEEGDTVTLTVAKAPPQVEVPDVLDLSEADARTALTGAGFRVRRVREEVQTPDEDGVVVDQDPPAGEERREGSRVTIFVGRFTPDLDPEPEPTATPTPDPGA